MSKLLNSGEVTQSAAPGGVPILRLAFRPFFLLGALFSLLSMGVWAALLTGYLETSLYGGMLWWHSHEMLFGFVAAIVAGFLLTAVQTWTGVPGLRGGWLAALVVLWLLPRVGFLFAGDAASWLFITADLLFLPAVAAVLGRSVVMVKQWRNIIFVPVLLFMAAANAIMHQAVLSGDIAPMSVASLGMVLLVALLMTVVAGRVVPMFTANGTGTARVPDLGWLERASLVSAVSAVIVGVSASWLPPGLVAVVFILAAAIHAYRALRWRLRVTLRTPLVWSLHLSYWSIPTGFLLFGLSALPGEIFNQTQAIHALTVGGMGLMILAMISRVSLGHTGRPITVGRLMTLALVSVFLAFVVRVFGEYVIADYAAMILIAAGLWVFGYGCFMVRYLGVLTQSRPDGRPG